MYIQIRVVFAYTDFFMLRFIRLLIETNLFIAIAGACFMWANVVFLDLHVASLYILSAQIFFSTWFVYQISRWIYFKKGEYSNKDELVAQWFEKYPNFNKFTIYGAGFATVIFTLFLRLETIFVLGVIGAISVLYPVQILKPLGITTRLRDFPFVKIFLIAFVWSATSVILPYTESKEYVSIDKVQVLLMFVVQFIYILFITLPFDINDAESDKSSDMKTIPSVFGITISKWIAFFLGLLYLIAIVFMYMLMNWNHLPNKYLSEISIISIITMIVALQIFTFLKSDKVSKFWIKMVYDGSMILYFLLIYLLNIR